MFINREKEIRRLQLSLSKLQPQTVVLYGRRRCGKSTLLRKVLPADAVYFAADLREKALQIAALAKEIDQLIPGFALPVYPEWETLFSSFNLALRSQTTLCIDEFPYLVKNSPELPSVLQKFIDTTPQRLFHLILCGSSQQMMYSLALDNNSTLYGRCNEIMRIRPMKVSHMAEYLQLTPEQAIEEYGVWGGVPRYWEIRRSSSDFDEALKVHVLDQYGLLYEEPERIFNDEMRTSVQAFSLLSLIGTGSHRLSEIAARMGKPATQLSRLLAFLTDLDYIRREIPYGETIRSTKKTLYKINDPYLGFYFRFLVTNKSRLEFGLVDDVLSSIKQNFDQYISGIWEELCRNSVPLLTIAGKRFNPAARWWGTVAGARQTEIDIIAESVDKKALLIAEVKWTKSLNVEEIAASLQAKCEDLSTVLPGFQSKEIIRAVFTRVKPDRSYPGIYIFTPEDLVL